MSPSPLAPPTAQSSMGSSADRLSPSLLPPPSSSEDGQKLAEAEKRVSELQAQLSSLEKERFAAKTLMCLYSGYFMLLRLCLVLSI